MSETDKRLWVVCYDVSDARRLRRVARIMERFGVRVQKSVFECWLDDGLMEQLKSAADAVLKPQEDSLRLYTMCETCRSVCESAGGTLTQTEKQYYIA